MYDTFGYKNKFETKTSVSRRRRIAQMWKRSQSLLQYCNGVQIARLVFYRPWIPRSTTRSALGLWDLIVAVLGNTNQNRREQGHLLKNKREVCSPPHTIQKRKKSHRMINDLDNVDFISSNVHSSRKEALLKIFEDNEAVTKMIIKGRRPTMRRVSRTHRVALDWLFDRINLDPKIQIKYIDTKNQLADTLIKGNFTRDEWNHLLSLFNISHFSSINSLEAMSKRTQEDAGEERVTAKSKPMMNLASLYSVRNPNVLASTASESLVKTKSESQKVPLS